MDQDKIQVIQNWPTPRNLHDVQSFLGFCNYYRRFIRRFSEVARPLTAILRKAGKTENAQFQWTSAAQQAFQMLKYCFTSASILRHYDPNKETFLETDVSDYALGVVLGQRQEDGLIHPLAYHSR